MSASLPFGRKIVDSTFLKTKVVPAPGRSTILDSIDDQNPPTTYFPIDIGPPGPYRPEGWNMFVLIPAMPMIANGQTYSFQLLHSATDQSGYVPLNANISVTLTGSGGSGIPAQQLAFQLPSDTQRYLIIQQTTGAGAGDPSTTSWLTAGLYF